MTVLRGQIRSIRLCKRRVIVRRIPAGRAGALAAVFAAVLVTAGCSAYVWVEKVVPPAFDHSFIKTIAVPEFANRTSSPDAGKIMADRVEEILVNESGYKVVTRMELNRLMDEHKLSVDGHLDSGAMNRLGRVGAWTRSCWAVSRRGISRRKGTGPGRA